MKINGYNLYMANTNKKTPDYPQKNDNVDGYGKKESNSPDYYDYTDEYAGGGGGNSYEYSGPDGTYDYDPYH